MRNKVVNLKPDVSKALNEYRTKGEASYKKFGVHHLSKSSVDNILDCSEKFILKSRYFTPGKALVLGGAIHEIQEDISSRVSALLFEKFGNKIVLKNYEKVYPEVLDKVLSDYDVADNLIQEVTTSLREVLETSKEVILPVTYAEFKADVFGTAETITKSLKKTHLRELLKYPVLNCETRTTYIPEGLQIPYDGYLDLLVIDGGNLRVEDLKTTFSKNNYVWESMLTPFQLWLYANSLVQNGYCLKLPGGGITRLVIDTKPKAKARPSQFDITVERKIIPDLSIYDRRYKKLLAHIEDYVTAGVAFNGMPKYGCAKCGYAKVCTKKYTPEWENTGADEEGGDDVKS